MPWKGPLPGYRVFTRAWQIGSPYFVEREDGSVVGPVADKSFAMRLGKRQAPELDLTLLADSVELVSDDAEYEAAAHRFDEAQLGPEEAARQRDAKAARRDLEDHYAHARAHELEDQPQPDDAHLRLGDEAHAAAHDELGVPGGLEPVGDAGDFVEDEPT